MSEFEFRRVWINLNKDVAKRLDEEGQAMFTSPLYTVVFKRKPRLATVSGKKMEVKK